MIDRVRQILADSSSVTDVVGTKIFYSNPPQGTQLPYIVIEVDQGIVNDTKDGASELDQNEVEIFCYCSLMVDESGISGAATLIRIVESVLNRYEDSTLFIKSSSTYSTGNYSIPNKPMYEASQNFEVVESR